jgi:hypothetical protein
MHSHPNSENIYNWLLLPEYLAATRQIFRRRNYANVVLDYAISYVARKNYEIELTKPHEKNPIICLSAT